MYDVSDGSCKAKLTQTLDAILKVNQELIEANNKSQAKKSVVKLLGERMGRMAGPLKKKDFQGFYKEFIYIIKYFLIRLKITKLPASHPRAKIDIKNQVNDYFSDERIAVYTVLFGNYDSVQEPLFVPDNCDFYLITDQDVQPGGVWCKYDIDDFDHLVSGYSNVEKNRFFKMMPHLLFPDYKYSVYIDANVQAVGDFTALVNKIGKVGIALHSHCDRNCVYEEVKAASVIGKISKKEVKPYLEYLEEAAMPREYGLFECNVLARRHNLESVIKIMDDWWHEFYHGKVKRDQLYLPIVLVRNGAEPKGITTLGSNVHRNPFVQVMSHK